MSVCNKRIWMIANSGSDLMLYKIVDYAAGKASSDLILKGGREGETGVKSKHLTFETHET